jgi:RecA-family ATPase
MRFGPYDLLIFDTFAQVTPGANENTAEDMGKALQAAKTLGRAAGDAMVLLVHHSGKDSTKGARGHSSLRAACDFEAEVTRVDQARALSITKLKDGNDGAEYNFYLENIDLEADEEGETVKSCVVKYGKSVKVRSEKPLGGVEKVVMDQIKELTLFEAEVDQELLISACVSQLPQDDSKRDQRKNRVFRALESLILARKVVLKEGKISAV